MASKKFSRLSILLEARDKMSGVFNKAANASKKLSNNVNKLGGQTKKTKKEFDYSQMSLLKNSKAMSKNADAAKKSILLNNKLVKSVRLGAAAMSDFASRSTRIQKVKSVVSSLFNPFRKLNDIVKSNTNNLRQFDDRANKLKGRRATFNQLADSNQRLNRQLEKMNRELSRANGRLGSMRTNLGSINMMGAAFTGMYTGQMAGQAGSSVAKSTIGYAWEQQYSKEGISILAGEENGEAYYKKILDYASTTIFSPEDWSQNLRGAIGRSKSAEDLEKYMMVIEQLATLDPVQGLDGAALAIRELNSGDSKSLVERFELPRYALDEIRRIEDPIKQIEATMEVIGKETGFSVDKIQEMKKLPLMQWEKAKNIWKTMNGYIGAAAAEKVAPLVQKFNDMWDAGEMQPFIDKASSLLASITEKIINFAMNFTTRYESMMNSVKSKNGPLLELFGNIKNTFDKAKPTLKEIFDNIVGIVNRVAGVGNDMWPTIDKLIQMALKGIEIFTGLVDRHFEKVLAVLAAFAGGTLFLKIAAGIAFLGKVIAAIKVGKLLAMFPMLAGAITFLISPLGIAAVAIGGLVAAGVYLYRNFDEIKSKATDLWEVLKDNPVMWIVAGPFMALIHGIVALVKNWDNIKNKIKEVWDMITDSPLSLFITTLINPFIGAVATLASNWDLVTGAFKKFTDLITGFKLPQWIKDIGGGFKQAWQIITRDESERGRSHHGGISNIPHDNYKAILHKGERVLTRQENKDYNDGTDGGVLITGNSFVVREDADVIKIANQLYRLLKERV